MKTIRKPFLFLLCLLTALCLLFAGCTASGAAKDTHAEDAAEDTYAEDAAGEDFLHSFYYKDCTPIDVARFLAQQAGCPCSVAPELTGSISEILACTTNVSCFGDDGVGFCCLFIDSGGHASREYAVLTTYDYGENWVLTNDSFWVSTSLREVVAVIGDYAYVRVYDWNDVGDSLMVISRDGTNPLFRHLYDLAPAEKRSGDVSFRLLNVIPAENGGVTVSFSMFDRYSDSFDVISVFDRTFAGPTLEPELPGPMPETEPSGAAADETDWFRWYCEDHPFTCSETYQIARWLAHEAGYGCDCLPDAPERVGTLPKHCSFFGEDGVGFCLIDADANRNAKMCFLFGTADYGKTWNCGEMLDSSSVNVETLSETAVQCGDYFYITETKPWDEYSNIYAVKKDGSFCTELSPRRLLPEEAFTGEDSVAFADLRVNEDGTLTVAFTAVKEDDPQRITVFERIFDRPLPTCVDNN